MCGIFGVVGPALARHMADLPASGRRRLGHRGPDDRGELWLSRAGSEWCGSEQPPRAPVAAFLHDRLAVLDLSPCGRQPMSTDDRRLHLLYNGEIYDYLERREELAAGGVRFRSRGDTEVLLQALARWGEAALGRVTGMFALAAVDLRSGRMLLARDPFGIKPLFYAHLPGGFAFASEIKALLDLPGLSRRADAQRVYDYLAWGQTDAGSRTFFGDIRRLPGGHWMAVDLATGAPSDPVCYAPLRLGPARELPLAEAAERVRETFLESIRLHLRSDVRVGCALSGGIDSAAIVAGMRAVGGRELEIRCYGHVTDERGIGEERWMDLVGQRTGAVIRKTRPTAGEMLRDLDGLIRGQDEPFGSSSIYAQYRVFQAAAGDGTKVMLDGQGADEMLAGYRPYTAGRLATLIARGRMGEVLRLWRAAGSFPDGGRRAGHLARALWLLARPAVLRAGPGSRRLRGCGWLDRRWFASRGVRGRALPSGGHPDRLRALLLDSFLHTSLPALLRYEDRNSMAHSIESRVPFLTPPLARLLFSLPESFLLSPDGRTKHVFREAMRGIVPEEVLQRPDKIGFATPERSWMVETRPALEAILGSETARGLPLWRHQAVLRHEGSILGGSRRFDQRVWRQVNLVRWAELRGVRFD